MTPLPFLGVAMVAPWPLPCWLALCRHVPEPPPPGCLDSAVAEAATMPNLGKPFLFSLHADAPLPKAAPAATRSR
jgi:hypothetical protein